MSKFHFDPALDRQRTQYGHSVGIISKLFYDSLSKLGEVTYIDCKENLKGQEFDLLVGMPRNFHTLTHYNKIGLSICYLNVSAPGYTKRTLNEEAKKLGCKLSDCFVPRKFQHADHFFMLGSDFVKEQYIKEGMDPTKITMLNYGMEAIPFKPRDINRPPRFLHLATTMGLRKGFWHVINDFKKANLDSELHCVGKVPNERFWYEFAREAAKDPRIFIHGWINCSDPKYAEIIHNSDFIVFPSLAEGQGGTTMEGIASGCVPIVAEESAFPHYPIGPYIRGDVSVWHRAYNLDNKRFREIQLEMQELLRTKYNNNIFKQIVEDTIKKLI